MISQNFANTILNSLFNVYGKDKNGSTMPDGHFFKKPNQVFLGLCANEPIASDGSLTQAGEPNGKDKQYPYYERKEISGKITSEGSGSSTTWSQAIQHFGQADGGIIMNSAEIQFITARHAIEDKMNYWFLSDSKTGNAFLWGEITNVDGTQGIQITENTVPTFYPGELKASLDVALTE